jgi:hypothetical protein
LTAKVSGGEPDQVASQRGEHMIKVLRNIYVQADQIDRYFV